MPILDTILWYGVMEFSNEETPSHECNHKSEQDLAGYRRSRHDIMLEEPLARHEGFGRRRAKPNILRKSERHAQNCSSHRIQVVEC